jgi:micrococcal nuclease
MACQQADSSKTDGKVVSIADGDTFTLLTPDNKQVKVRLHGVDCPERAQDFGQVARQKLSDLVFNQPVKLEVMDTDRYGRTVAIVYTQNGTCINEELLKNGLAWHYKEYDDNADWTRLEQQARKAKVGLWSQRRPVAPWNWRKEKRTGTKKAA